LYFYTPEAVENGESGRVTVQFAVNAEGKICNIKILKGASVSLDKETTRVLKESPLWVPAKLSGKTVSQQFVIPVIFMIQ